jgi:type II secretory ATPase GspE/PulE/Tfp pilus assembly ATPase PilB-like protein
MLPLEAVRLDRFAVPGGIWLVTALAWAAVTVWMERDARSIFGRSLPWKILFVAIGVAVFLGTYQLGQTALPFLVPLVVLTGVAYILAREAVAAPDVRLIPIVALGEGLRRAVRVTGLEGWLQRIRGNDSLTGSMQLAGPSVMLLKKDGSIYSGDAGRGGNRELSQAIFAAQGILADAVAKRATDMHFEPKTGHDVQVRYRIDGMMQTMHVLPAEAGRAIISALKVVGDMDIAEKRRPQDGTFAVLADNRKFDVRAASGPTNFGEKMALRLLDAGGGIVKGGLGGLGMRDSTVQALRGIIHRAHGMLIVCGPTGSGKTTTTYGALSEIDVLSRNIVTIEDPIEYRLDNISQTAVNNAADLTFAKILRSTLRQDPDVILVGEVRDKETAEIAMQAALTGHFVFTTLHANDTATTVTRLLDIGIDATLIQSAVTAVLAQRLVRLLCPKCKEAYRPPPELLRRLGLPGDKVPVLYKEVGCSECHGTGFRGRTGIYELMVFDTAIRNLLVGRPSIEMIRDVARKNGMRTLLRQALVKACEGATSISEAERVTQ